MFQRAFALCAATLLAALFGLMSCGSPPTPAPPQAVSLEDEAPLAEDNERLRAQVVELESRLQSANADRDRLVTSESAASDRARAAETELDKIAREEMLPAKLQDDVTYSIPVATGVVDGPKNALVTIVVATEAACVHCWTADERLKELRKIYKKDLRVVYQTRIIHRHLATIPAHAMCAANRQGKGVKMWAAIGKQFKLFRSGSDKAALGSDAMRAVAKKLRLKMKRFKKDLDGEECAAEIKAQNTFFVELGVNGTPTFFINGRVLHGAKDLETMKQAVEQRLTAARDLVAAGIDRKSVYAAITAFGKKSP